MAKIAFDPNDNDPEIQRLIAVASERAAMAYASVEPHADGIRSVFAFHPIKKRPHQIGSGVFLAVAGELFLLSASHVFEEIGPCVVGVGCGNQILKLRGERFSFLQGPSGTHQDDPIDVSVLHIQQDVPPEILASALTISAIAVTAPSTTMQAFVALGFRANKGKMWSKRFHSRQDRFPTVEHDSSTYAELGLSRQMHTVVAFDEQVLLNGRWQRSPKLVGLSGGGLFRVEGLSMNPDIASVEMPVARLSAIIIEIRKRAGGHHALIGSNIQYHLGLIDAYCPGLLPR